MRKGNQEPVDRPSRLQAVRPEKTLYERFGSARALEKCEHQGRRPLERAGVWWAAVAEALRDGGWRSGVVSGAAVAVVLGVSIVHLGVVFALVASAMVGGLLLLALVRGLVDLSDPDIRRRVIWWTVVAFSAHLLFGMVATNFSRSVRLYLATDSFTYDTVAQEIAQHWKSGYPMPFVPDGKEGFYYLLAGLYWLFGAHSVAGLVANATLSAALVPLTFDTTKRLFGAAAARYAVPLVVVLPGLFLWTSQLMKEAGMIFLLAVALNCAVRLVDGISLGALAILVVALVLAFTFRAWVALVVAAGLLIGIAAAKRQLVSGLGTGVSTAVIAGALMLGSGLGYSGYKAAINSDLQQADVLRRDLAVGAATGYDSDAVISTTGGALAYLPRGAISFLLGPFPWQISGARQLPFVPDVIVWWFLLPSLWEGYREARRRIGRRQLVMVLPALAILLLMSLALGNFGTVVRERLQMIILIVPLIALGLARRASRRSTFPDPLVARTPRGPAYRG